MGMGGKLHASAALAPVMTRYPLYRRLGGPQGRSGHVLKISPSPGFDPRTVQPIANRYTDYYRGVRLESQRVDDYNEVVTGFPQTLQGSTGVRVTRSYVRVTRSYVRVTRPYVRVTRSYVRGTRSYLGLPCHMLGLPGPMLGLPGPTLGLPGPMLGLPVSFTFFWLILLFTFLTCL
jgi:hypothetical protein